MRDAGGTGRRAQTVEAIAQVAHEAMAVTDHLGAAEALEAAHTPRLPLEVLVVALDGADTTRLSAAQAP